MRIPRLQTRTLDRLLGSGLLLIAIAAGLGLYEPESATEDRRGIQGAQSASLAPASSESTRCEADRGSA